MKTIITLLVTTAMAPTHIAEAQTKYQAYVKRVKMAPVTNSWSGAVNTYTGGSYGVSHIRALMYGGPRGKVRQPILDAAVRYHIPFNLLVGIWGAESGWGRAWNHFGLIGPANGNLRHDAFIAAKILRRLYGRNAV